MEQLISKVEQILEKQLADFESKPISTSIKFLVILWILKFIYREIKR